MGTKGAKAGNIYSSLKSRGLVGGQGQDPSIKGMGSPLKQVDKAGQRIIKQGDKAEAAYKAGDDKKGNRHAARATRMNTRDEAKKLKDNLKNSPAKKKSCKY